MSKFLCALALTLSGCAIEAPETSVIASSIADCNPLVCPGNSDLLGALGPNELDVTGLEVSKRGFALAGMTHGGVPVLDFQVVGASIQVTTGAGVFTGPGAMGLKLLVTHDSGASLELLVDDYLTSKVPFYAGGPPAIDGYHLSYRRPGTREWKDACPYETFDAGVAGTWAVFWKGDRIDPDAGTIIASGAAVGPWFNMSCAGSAEIKMLRARTGEAVAPASPRDQRLATLNMFTASYCGLDEKHYTKLGQDIAWSDLSGPSNIGAVSSREAVWGPNGAVCIDTPRLYPLAEIGCAIPTCTATTAATWPLVGWLFSGNP